MGSGAESLGQGPQFERQPSWGLLSGSWQSLML